MVGLLSLSRCGAMHFETAIFNRGQRKYVNSSVTRNLVLPELCGFRGRGDFRFADISARSTASPLLSHLSELSAMDGRVSASFVDLI